MLERQLAIDAGIGQPCIVKPVMSRSGKGQSRIEWSGDMAKAGDHAVAGGRVILKGFIRLDHEVTLFTVGATVRPRKV